MIKTNGRRSGVLLHISSLPGAYGIGDFGSAAYRFADFLATAGYSAWQVLPFSPVADILGNSPYSSSSAFAMSFLFLSPEKLVEIGLISDEDCDRFKVDSAVGCDYNYARKAKGELLHLAWDNFQNNTEGFRWLRDKFNVFCVDERAWLEDYTLFYILKESLGGICWGEWPREYKFRDPSALSDFLDEDDTARRLEYVQFEQFLLRCQWDELHAYCKGLGIEIIGDIPMYVAYDSADVWAGQEFFDLNESGYPNKVAGVPPDYFSETGQYWGNPVFSWDVLRKTSFRWWVSRLKSSLALFDRVRIDHFRGFSRYWAIPAEHETAVGGSWEIAPGREFFETLQRELAGSENEGLPLIAEDLGVITEDVHELMERFDIPGMKVLLFAFNGDCDNPYLPHNHGRNFVVYTGTHDNDTVNGWWEDTSDYERGALESYVGSEIKNGAAHGIINRLALASVAQMAIIPAQDILGLGLGARMNLPGWGKGCWEWRLTVEQFDELTSMTAELRRLKCVYGRHG